MNDITREQYDNAVRIRKNDFTCCALDFCCVTCGNANECGYHGKGATDDNKKKRREWISNRISTYEAEHPEEFRTSPDPGEGWRWLEREKDILQEGDEVVGTCEFFPVPESSAGQTVWMTNTFRRRIAKPPRIYDYRDVELPEVQALIGHEAMVSNNLYSLAGGLYNKITLKVVMLDCPHPFIDSCGIRWQFIRAIDDPKIKLTRAELIAIAAKSRGVKPEQIVVEE